MATYLLCSTPLSGHVEPLVTVGAYLLDRGHRVIFLTGSRFEGRVAGHGLEFVALGGAADFDERDPATFVPDLGNHRGLALSRYQIESTFVRPIPDQHRALRRVLDGQDVDAVLADGTFAGVLPTLGRAAGRPPIFGAGVMPLAQTSRDVPPFSSGLAPSSTAFGRARNRALNVLGRRVLFAKPQRLATKMVAEAGGGQLAFFALDISAAFDRFLQLGPAEFEYPRSDLAANTVFAGPVRSARATAATPLPPWWDELRDGRPVVQGTLGNHDFSSLVTPSLDALAGEDLHVVVSTGGPPVETIGPTPANARVVEFVPHEQLLPLTDVVVTNGGYGGVLHALRHGVALVVAPTAEDKPEVAARVAHFGVGINLRTGRPTRAQIGRAVSDTLGDGRSRDRARAMAEVIARYRPLETIEAELGRAARSSSSSATPR